MEIIKNIIRILRPFDYILLIIMIVISYSPLFILRLSHLQSEENNIYAVISINGEEVDRFLLSENEEHKLITYHPGPNQYNIVEIDGERIRNKEDNSPEQVAVRTGWIQYPGEISINIPHRFLIQIISETPTDGEIDIIALGKEVVNIG